MQDGAAAKWGRWLGRSVTSHILGFLEGSQKAPLVVCHFGWLAMLCLVLGDVLPRLGLPTNDLGQVLLTTYERLGGVDENGRGGLAELMEVYAKVSLGIYALGWAVERVRGPIPPWPLRRRVKVSTVTAAGGYLMAFLLLPFSSIQNQGSVGDWACVMVSFTVATAFASHWAFSISDFCHSLRSNLWKEPEAEAPTGVPLPPS